MGWALAAAYEVGYLDILGVKPLTSGGKPDANTVVPLLFDHMFPDWFAGIAFAAIGIGALVPAAIMSIAAANLFTRNIYREYLRPEATHAEEARVSKLASLAVTPSPSAAARPMTTSTGRSATRRAARKPTATGASV